MEFTIRRVNPIPLYGSAAVPAVAQWPERVRLRGETSPRPAKYCLMAFGDAMGVKCPIEHPAVRAAATVRKLKAVKTAAVAPLGFIEKREIIACDDNAPQGLQLVGPLFV